MPRSDTPPREANEKTGSLGSDLLFRPVSREVPSALESLTAGFGMGPGVSSPPLPPREPVLALLTHGTLKTEQNAASSRDATMLDDQALDH